MFMVFEGSRGKDAPVEIREGEKSGIKDRTNHVGLYKAAIRIPCKEGT